MVGEQVRLESDQQAQLARGSVGDGEGVDDGETHGVAESGVSLRSTQDVAMQWMGGGGHGASLPTAPKSVNQN